MTDVSAPVPDPAPYDAQAPAGSDVVLVALVAANRVIGDGKDQPFRFREDFARFKRLTSGHPLVMGRTTCEAIGRLLPGRETVVLTRDESWSWEGAHVAHDLGSALATAGALPGGERIMILGGGQVYAATMPIATHLELTEVDAEADGDVLFPAVEEDVWTEADRDDRWGFSFVSYRRRA